MTAFALALIAALPASASAAPLPAAAFAYNSSAPLEMRTVRTASSGGAVQREVTFASPKGGRIHALIVMPAHARGPAVLCVHWLGDAKTTNLSEFLPDALALAKQGTTSLLIDAMWSQPRWFEHGRTTATDYRASIKQVVDLRRSLDVLSSLPGVDRNRMAYVGHDFGAMYGAVLSGVDARPRAYVLMAGTPVFSEWYLLGPKPADVQAYVAQMSPLDPPGYLQRSQAAAYLFQFSQRDAYISPQREEEFAASAPAPKATFVYRSTHALAEPQIRADRLAWLRSRLGI
jgi:dienelactone hydrolase